VKERKEEEKGCTEGDRDLRTNGRERQERISEGKRTGERKDMKQDQMQSFKRVENSPSYLSSNSLIIQSLHLFPHSSSPISSLLTMDREAVTAALSLSLLPPCVLSP
jgi:hypothetical protein